MESVRTARGPRSHVVAYLGALPEAERRGVADAAEGHPPVQRTLFEERAAWVEVDTSRIRVERLREFGGPWLGQELLRQVGLDVFFSKTIPGGREEIPWSVMAQVLVLSRLCDPSSELYIAEHFYRHSALPDLLGIAVEKINDDRLYRALDQLLPHKEALERHLKDRLGTLFDLDYDGRSDCKQVCIGLVVSRCGMPLGYEVFAGNRHDSTTMEEIVETMERRYGRSNRIWVMDRGMVSQEHIEFLQQHGRRYLVGTPKSVLKKFEHELLSEHWETIREGLEVKKCPSPDGQETFSCALPK